MQGHHQMLLMALRALPTMAYCFSSQAVYPPALEALQKLHAGLHARTLSRRLTDATFSFTLLAYLCVGVGGYVAVRGNAAWSAPPPNVLDAYVPGSAGLVCAQLALIIALGLSFPLMFIVARTHALSLLEPSLRDVESAHVPITVGGVVGCLVVAVLFPQVEAVLGLIGSTCSVSLSFVIPAILYRDMVGIGRRASSDTLRLSCNDAHGAPELGSSGAASEASEPESTPAGAEGSTATLPRNVGPSSSPQMQARLGPGLAATSLSSPVASHTHAGHGRKAGQAAGRVTVLPGSACAAAMPWAALAVYGSITFGLLLAALSLPLQISELVTPAAPKELVLEQLAYPLAQAAESR